MKLLYVTHGLNIGGAEILVVKLAEQASQKYEISVVTLDRDGELRNDLEKITKDIYLLDRKPGIKLEDFLKFFKICRKISPQLIHAHQYTCFLYAVLYKIFIDRRVKLIFTEHGRHFPDIVSKKRQIVNQLLVKFTESITAVCEFSKRALREKEKIHSKIEVIYNGVEESSIEEDTRNSLSLRAKFNLASDALLVGYIGSLRLVKNPALLLEAFAQYKTGASDNKGKLIFIGDGQLRLALEARVKELSLEQDIFFTGNIMPAEPYLRQFDIFVQPSLSEAHSLALLSAMARSVPVIASNVGGASESIVHGENGFLCESENISDLTKYLDLLIKDNELRLKFGAKSREIYESRFTAQLMYQRYLDLYERICERNN